MWTNRDFQLTDLLYATDLGIFLPYISLHKLPYVIHSNVGEAATDHPTSNKETIFLMPLTLYMPIFI